MCMLPSENNEFLDAVLRGDNKIIKKKNTHDHIY